MCILGVALNKVILDRLGSTINIFKELYREQGILSAFSSTRTHNLLKSLNDVFLNHNINEFLLYNPNFIKLRVEMELYGLIIFWGILGVVIYIYCFIVINRGLKLSKTNFLIGLYLLFVSFFVGKLLTNFIALFLIYTLFTINKKQDGGKDAKGTFS